MASDWKIDEQPDKVVLHAAVACVIDDTNRFTAIYEYTIDAAGRLSVHYRLTPDVQVHWISQVGVSFQLPSSTKQLRWLGLGPLDTYPKEKTAGVLGVWTGTLGGESLLGNNSTRWVEATAASGATVHFHDEGYMRTDTKQPSQIQLLSSVLGRASSQCTHPSLITECIGDLATV